MLMVGIAYLAGTSASGTDLAVAMVTLGGTAVLVGFIAILLAARATVAPVNAVRRALNEVREGELDVQVPVYDGTQIGDLQLGFNQMVHGLSERQRIREALGAYVDPDVAEQILEEGTDLAGEQVDVTVLFVDVRDFTAFAESHEAEEVVAALNRLFEAIVPIVHDNGGRVDKFTGDGLLAVFGAPRRLSEHADCALAAARKICEAAEEAGDFQVGIGLNSGEVVAGNLGGGGRLEFSVIGDVVNVAARAEAATRETHDSILVTQSTKDSLTKTDTDLEKRQGVELKGKSESVALYAVLG
jgi:adenylate cyclase